jgi:hypothetical protein
MLCWEIPSFSHSPIKTTGLSSVRTYHSKHSNDRKSSLLRFFSFKTVRNAAQSNTDKRNLGQIWQSNRGLPLHQQMEAHSIRGITLRSSSTCPWVQPQISCLAWFVAICRDLTTEDGPGANFEVIKVQLWSETTFFNSNTPWWWTTLKKTDWISMCPLTIWTLFVAVVWLFVHPGIISIRSLKVKCHPYPSLHSIKGI